MVLSTMLRAQSHPDEVQPQLLHMLDVSSAVNRVKSSESYPSSVVHWLCVLGVLFDLSGL